VAAKRGGGSGRKRVRSAFKKALRAAKTRIKKGRRPAARKRKTIRTGPKKR
jgi:hypothetical protein